MFPTFQLSVSGCGVCLDPGLIQFLRHLPLEAYSRTGNTTSTDIGHTHEATQLLDLEAPPIIGAPSVTADEAQESSLSKFNLLSFVKGYATKVREASNGRDFIFPPSPSPSHPLSLSPFHLLSFSLSLTPSLSLSLST